MILQRAVPPGPFLHLQRGLDDRGREPGCRRRSLRLTTLDLLLPLLAISRLVVSLLVASLASPVLRRRRGRIRGLSCRIRCSSVLLGIGLLGPGSRLARLILLVTILLLTLLLLLLLLLRRRDEILLLLGRSNVDWLLLLRR